MAGCTGGASVDRDPGDLAFPLVEPGSADELGLLAFVNDGETTVGLLHLGVALDERAALSIVAWRNGADEAPSTSDDRLFASVPEIDALAWVGPNELERLLDFARGEGWMEDRVEPDSVIGDAGDECTSDRACVSGLHCYGLPSDGSAPHGQCVDPTAMPGEGASCARTTDCGSGLICAGWTLSGEGTCNPDWMAGRFEKNATLPLQDVPAGGISPWVVVYGLAEVPVDLEVVLHIEHPRPSDLRVTLVDPNGAESTLWDRSPDLSEWNRTFVTSIARDSDVNGRWHLRIEDVVAGGGEGTFHGWSLFAVSRWN